MSENHRKDIFIAETEELLASMCQAVFRHTPTSQELEQEDVGSYWDNTIFSPIQVTAFVATRGHRALTPSRKREKRLLTWLKIHKLWDVVEAVRNKDEHY